MPFQNVLKFYNYEMIDVIMLYSNAQYLYTWNALSYPMVKTASLYHNFW